MHARDWRLTGLTPAGSQVLVGLSCWEMWGVGYFRRIAFLKPQSRRESTLNPYNRRPADLVEEN